MGWSREEPPNLPERVDTIAALVADAGLTRAAVLVDQAVTLLDTVWRDTDQIEEARTSAQCGRCAMAPRAARRLGLLGRRLSVAPGEIDRLSVDDVAGLALAIALSLPAPGLGEHAFREVLPTPRGSAWNRLQTALDRYVMGSRLSVIE